MMLFCRRTRDFNLKTGTSIFNLTTRGATIDFKSRPLLQTFKYRPAKHLWHWLKVATFKIAVTEKFEWLNSIPADASLRSGEGFNLNSGCN